MAQSQQVGPAHDCSLDRALERSEAYARIGEAAMSWLMERTPLFTQGTKIVTSKGIKYRASDGFPTKRAITAADTRYREAIPPIQRLRKNAMGFEKNPHVTAAAAKGRGSTHQREVDSTGCWNLYVSPLTPTAEAVFASFLALGIEAIVGGGFGTNFRGLARRTGFVAPPKLKADGIQAFDRTGAPAVDWRNVVPSDGRVETEGNLKAEIAAEVKRLGLTIPPPLDHKALLLKRQVSRRITVECPVAGCETRFGITQKQAERVVISCKEHGRVLVKGAAGDAREAAAAA